MTGASSSPRRAPDVDRADIERRFKGFSVPEQPQRPAGLTPEGLSRFGLPPRPGDAAHPLLRKVWDLGFGQELALVGIDFDQVVKAMRGTSFRIAARRAAAVSLATSATETSRNWAGVYVTASCDRQLSQIWGVWTAPSGLVRPSGSEASDLPFACSNWIGLDGQRLYLDSSLPQAGTVSLLQSDGTTAAQAWVQWWGRTAPQNAPTILPLPLSPGDDVLAVLTATADDAVIAVLVNLSRTPRVGVAVSFAAPAVDAGGVLVTPKIAGATAEWILERPSIPNSPDIFNFPDYGSSTFTFCIAVESTALDLGALSEGAVRLLHGASLIRMVEIDPDPARIEILSLSRRCDATTARITYGGFS